LRRRGNIGRQFQVSSFKLQEKAKATTDSHG
jgi:hypothetical protein